LKVNPLPMKKITKMRAPFVEQIEKKNAEWRSGSGRTGHL